MGYSYEVVNGYRRLCCDRCDTSMGVRKRICPHRVQYADGSSLPYCPPPALCAACYRAEGGSSLHDDCREPAEARSRLEEARGIRLDRGELEVAAAWGNWHKAVPPGMVGVWFRGKWDEAYRLIRADVYDPTRLHWLSDYGDATLPWHNPDQVTAATVSANP